MTERRTHKIVAGAGILAVLGAGITGVIGSGLTGGTETANSASGRGATLPGTTLAGATLADTDFNNLGTPDPDRTVSADIPLLNTALAPEDTVRLPAATRGQARTALLDGTGVTFTIDVDGDSREITTAATNLADALAEAGVALGWQDQVDADLTAAPEAGARVHIGRAATEYVTEVITQPYESETRETDSLLIGEKRVVRQGVAGQSQVTSQITRIDGEEVARSTVASVDLTPAVSEIIEVGTRKKPTAATGSAQYSLSQFMSAGVINWGGYKFTYYSQQVLPGGGLNIPGRHVNAGGYVADKDGYIVLANSAPKGTIINTPFGYKGKVYDRGTVGNHYDVYIR